LVNPFRQSNIAVGGTSSSFIIALATVVLWALTGPLFDYSNGWQLIINTSTTIITFLRYF
jgi:Predicted small integral membrane protein